MRKPSEDHSFHFFSVFCGDGGVGVGGGVGLVWRQLHGSGIVVSTKKRETKATGGARARSPATIRHIVPFSCYANETSQHVGN